MHTFQHITAESSCGGIYAGVYCILYHVYDVVVKKVLNLSGDYRLASTSSSTFFQLIYLFTLTVEQGSRDVFDQ